MLLATPNNAQLERLLAAEDAITQAVATLGTRHGLESESAALLAARPPSHRDALPLLIWLLEVTAFLGGAAAPPRETLTPPTAAADGPLPVGCRGTRPHGGSMAVLTRSDARGGR